MAIQQHTAAVKFRDDEWKTLGRSSIQPGSVACAEGLLEGADFEIDHPKGLVRRLRVMGEDEQGLFTFTLGFDDGADAIAAAETQRADDLALVMKALPAEARVAFGRLVGIDQAAAEAAAVEAGKP